MRGEEVRERGEVIRFGEGVKGLGVELRGLEEGLRGLRKGICACFCVARILVATLNSVNGKEEEEEDEEEKEDEEEERGAGEEEREEEEDEVENGGKEVEKNDAYPASLPSLRPSFPSSALRFTKGLGVGKSFPSSEEPLTEDPFSLTAGGRTALSRLLGAIPSSIVDSEGRTGAGGNGEGRTSSSCSPGM